MSPTERTMREEGWVLTNELLDAPAPPVVEAFRKLYEMEWDMFVLETYDVDGVKFYNAEQNEFSAAKDWEQLCVFEGVPAFHDDLAIPAELAENVRQFLRQLRMEIHRRFHSTRSGSAHGAFFKQNNIPCQANPPGMRTIHGELIVHHDGEAIRSFFTTDTPWKEDMTFMLKLLDTYGLKLQKYNETLTTISQKK